MAGFKSPRAGGMRPPRSGGGTTQAPGGIMPPHMGGGGLPSRGTGRSMPTTTQALPRNPGGMARRLSEGGKVQSAPSKIKPTTSASGAVRRSKARNKK